MLAPFPQKIFSVGDSVEKKGAGISFKEADNLKNFKNCFEDYF